MDENSVERKHDVFFYGLYMDPSILESKGVVSRDPRLAKVHDYELRMGKKATLLRKKGAWTSGLVYSLTHREIDSLYRGSGLLEYFPEAMLAEVKPQGQIPVLCCNLLAPHEADEVNPDYEKKLSMDKERLGIEV